MANKELRGYITQCRNRQVYDYYVTPVHYILKLFKELIKVEPDIFKGYILDPCAGGDIDHEMSYPKALIEFGVHPKQIVTNDIRKDSRAKYKTNYLTTKGFEDKFHLIITNPPFNIAKEICEKALNDVKEGGFVVMLLRSTFFGSNDRFEFNKLYRPKWIFYEHERISFLENGSSDSSECVHVVWQKGFEGEFARFKVI